MIIINLVIKNEKYYRLRVVIRGGLIVGDECGCTCECWSSRFTFVGFSKLQASTFVYGEKKIIISLQYNMFRNKLNCNVHNQ